MGCDYKIYGSVSLRRSHEVDVLLETLRDRLHEDAVEVEELDENTVDLTLNFDDYTTIHTPLAMAEIFKQMEPFVIGAGSFDIETSGEGNWTEYLGTPAEVAKARSASALHLIQEHIDLLTSEDRAKLGVAGEVVALRNALGALLGNIPAPTAAELKESQPGSLAYNWQRAQALLEGVAEPELASDELIGLRKLHVVLQEELDALRIWRRAEPMNTDVLDGIDISISKISSMRHEATALLKSIPTSEPPPGEVRSEATTTAADVLKALISTVQATGGLVHFPDGTYGCAGDEEWLDLADVTIAAKQTLEDETGVVIELTITEIPEQS